MRIKDLENKKKKIKEELLKVETELKKRKELCIGDYGYKKDNTPYLVTKEDDETKFKRYGNIYDELKKMDDESNNYNDPHKVIKLIYKEDKFKKEFSDGTMEINYYNENEFMICWRFNHNNSVEVEIHKDTLYDFIMRTKYLLLREHGEEYRIKRKKKKKVEKVNKFENIDV